MALSVRIVRRRALWTARVTIELPQFWLIFVAGTYRRVTSHAKSKLEANVAKVGGLLPNSILTLYPLDGEVEPGDENSHHYRSVDGNTRVAVLPKL